MSVPIRTPTLLSTRFVLERTLVELHRCKNLARVKQVHAQIFKANLHRDLCVAPKLITSFSQCHQISLAINVFNLVPDPDVFLYNTLIRALVHNSQPSQAFEVFFRMQSVGIFADNFTYPFLLKACSGPSWLRIAEMVHAHIVKFGFFWDIYVPNSLIDCYSECGSVGVSSARRLFGLMVVRDAVSWNSMIGGLVKVGDLEEARQVFDEMPQRDCASWNTMLDGYVKAGKMDLAFQLFEKMPVRNVVSWSTMVSGYSRAGDIEMARMFFDKMPVKSLVPWTIIIAGYAERGIVEEATCLFDKMEKLRFNPDEGAVVSILAACAQSGLLILGMKVHAYIKRTRFGCSTQVSNALVDMYTKCGSLDKAMSVFNEMHEKDMVSWNTMLHGLAVHRHGDEALMLFSRMIGEGYAPDYVTFISLFCACTHAGFVNEGLHYFNRMKRDFGIAPQVEHYGCIIDLLGRGGYLRDAFRLVLSMPMEPNVVIWGTLLFTCRMHNAVELAEEVLDHLVKLENSDSDNYSSTLSNILATSGKWDSVAYARLQMKITRKEKPRVASSIKVGEEFREFTVSDRSHWKSEMVYQMIDRSWQDLKQDVYDPITNR